MTNERFYIISFALVPDFEISQALGLALEESHKPIYHHSVHWYKLCLGRDWNLLLLGALDFVKLKVMT